MIFFWLFMLIIMYISYVSIAKIHCNIHIKFTISFAHSWIFFRFMYAFELTIWRKISSLFNLQKNTIRFFWSVNMFTILWRIERFVTLTFIVIIQKQSHNINDMQSFNAAHNLFYLVKNTSSQSKTCIYVNKHLQFNQWIVKTAESNICSIRILTCNTDDKTQML